MTPSEEILVTRILESLEDGRKSAVAIMSYIKATYYRVETSHEIRKLIKYELHDKVKYDAVNDVYKLRSDNRENIAVSIPSRSPSKLPDKISILNELYERRQQLMSNAKNERTGRLKHDITEINAEIKAIGRGAINEYAHLSKGKRRKIERQLHPALRLWFEKQNIPIKERREKFIEELDEKSLEKEIEATEKAEEQNLDLPSSMSEEIQIEIIPIEKVIEIIIEEKTRLGKIDGNLLAENILFRIKKGKWD